MPLQKLNFKFTYLETHVIKTFVRPVDFKVLRQVASDLFQIEATIKLDNHVRV